MLVAIIDQKYLLFADCVIYANISFHFFFSFKRFVGRINTNVPIYYMQPTFLLNLNCIKKLFIYKWDLVLVLVL